MEFTDPELERVLRGLENAAAFAKSYHFEMTEDYLALIRQVEALPQNRAGADKSGRWRGSRAELNRILESIRRLPSKP